MKRKIIFILAILFCYIFAIETFAAPVASNPRFDGRATIGDDPIAPLPLITVQVTGVNVSFDAFVLWIDGAQVSTSNPYNYTYDGTDFSLQVSSRLNNGWHTFTLRARDDGGLMIPDYTFNGFVAAQAQGIIGEPLAIPNPATDNMRITYKLTGSGDVDIRIYNLNSELVWEQELSAGQTGAQVGYNEVVWDLRSGFGEECPNGAYLCVILKEEDESPVAMEKVKLFILR
ncbi:hypothetical protein ACFL5G_01505 [Candidatus Margulisiibacteriota bacterium]